MNDIVLSHEEKTFGELEEEATSLVNPERSVLFQVL